MFTQPLISNGTVINEDSAFPIPNPNISTNWTRISKLA